MRFHQFNPNFRRNAEESDWIRILTMLGLSAELYNDLTQENLKNNCPSKLICQAFESRDFLGFTFLSLFYDLVLINGFHFRPRGYLYQKDLPTVHFSSVPNWWWLKWQQTNRENLFYLLFLIQFYFSGRKLYMFLQVSWVRDVPDLIITKTTGGKKQFLEE